MSVLINFKICDNAPECSGVEVCPTKAITYNYEKKTVEIDNTKCISCGLCEKSCPIGAFKVAKTEEEYQKFEKEIEDDPRTTKNLFVDRYGATPLSEFFIIKEKDLKEKIDKNNLTLVECYNDDSIQCLLKSIPIKELTEDLPKDTLFYKMEVTTDFIEEQNLVELPTLLVFKNSDLLGKIEGYHTIDEKKVVMEELNDILKMKKEEIK